MDLLHAPQARCVDIIRQFSGHIVQTHGGGLLAYFGYPKADEHVARHAVQAALAVTCEAVHGIEIRAAVHTGLVITGGELSVPDTLGKTSKTTIQLRKSAGYGEVAISEQTQRIVAGYFDCISLGVQDLSDIARPLEIFKVVQESGARTRLDAAAQLTPLSGRKAEIAALMGLWDAATQGLSHVVLVQGEAGIGKSRLLHTLKERLIGQPYDLRELRCFPEFSQSPFHPIIATLEILFGFTDADTPEMKFDKLVGWVEHSETHHNQSPMRWVSASASTHPTHPTRSPASVSHSSESAQQAVPLLAQLLALPLTQHYQQSSLSPQQQKDQTIAILLDMLQTLAAQQPVLLIVEDLHWVDPSTLEVLVLLVEQTGNTPVLTLFTARPEFVPRWKETLQSKLTLTPLNED